MAGAMQTFQVVQGPTVNPTFVQARMNMPEGSGIDASSIARSDPMARSVAVNLSIKYLKPLIPGSREPDPIEVILARGPLKTETWTLAGIVVHQVTAEDLKGLDMPATPALGKFLAKTGIKGWGFTDRSRGNRIARKIMRQAIDWANQYLEGNYKLARENNDDRSLIQEYLEAAKFMRFLLALSVSTPEDQDEQWVKNTIIEYDPLRKSWWLGHYKSACMTIDPDKFKLLFPQFATDFDHLNISTSAQRTAQIAVGTKRLGTPVPFILEDIAASVNDGTRVLLLFISDHMMGRVNPQEMPPYVDPLIDSFTANNLEYLNTTIAKALGKYIYIAYMATLGNIVDFQDIGGITVDEMKVMQAIESRQIYSVIVGMFQNIPTLFTNYIERGELKKIVRDAVERELERNHYPTLSESLVYWARSRTI